MSNKSKIQIINFLPLAISISAVALILYFNEYFTTLITNKKLHLSGIYSAIFDWSAIQTGFLFSVYGFVVSKSDGFIGAIKNTTAMNNFNSYIKRATFIGFILTFCSMPLVMLSPKPEISGFLYSCIALWFGLFIWAFGSFLRVAYIFGLIVKVPDNKDIPA